MENFSRGKIITFVMILAVVVALLFSMRSMFEFVEADEICIIQDPLDGDLHMYTTGGVYWQNFGKVTKYKKEMQYWFTSNSEEGDKTDQSIKCRFNEGGHANISGSVRIKLPLSFEHMTKLHVLFGSQLAVERQLIRPLIEKSVYLTGPLMSSKESYADRRNDLLYYIEDQITNGVYKTRPKEVKEPDAITGELKTVTKVEIVMDTTKNIPVRTEKSPLPQYGVTVYNLSLKEIKYDATVEKQIAQQQAIAMDVQTSIANAKKAEQNAIRAEKEGEAKAMQAKWAQEVIKAKAVTEAEQKAKVAEWGLKEMEFYEKSQAKKAAGDAAYKRAIMTSDGGLTQKLETYERIMIKYAEMIGNYKGNWVPSIVMGGAGGNYNASESIFTALGVKTLKDLSLDMTIPKGATSRK